MGLAYSFKKLLSGDVEDAFNGFWVSDDLLAAQDAAGDNLSKIVQRQQAEALISAEEAQARYSTLSPNSSSEAYWETQGDTPWQEFGAGLVDSASAIGSFGSKAINRTLGIGFRVIPWQIWVALLIGLMIWFYPIWKPFAVALSKRMR